MENPPHGFDVTVSSQGAWLTACFSLFGWDQAFRKGTAHSRWDTKVQIARPRPVACRVSTRRSVLSINETDRF